jgi:hypothetical protein
MTWVPVVLSAVALALALLALAMALAFVNPWWEPGLECPVPTDPPSSHLEPS